VAGTPKMIDKDTFFKGVEATVKTPFRVVPFFQLFTFQQNQIDRRKFEAHSVHLKIEAVFFGHTVTRFGKDFPIRFDFLDTIGGGNLSLQVHPTTQFIRKTKSTEGSSKRTPFTSK